MSSEINMIFKKIVEIFCQLSSMRRTHPSCVVGYFLQTCCLCQDVWCNMTQGPFTRDDLMWCYVPDQTMLFQTGMQVPSYINCLFVMPQSHCAESTPEWGRIDNSSLFGWSFLVIPVHYSNDNDNQFEQCSSRPFRFSRSVRKFWTCSKSFCTQQCSAQILFIRGYAHWKRVVIFFVAQLTCCILVILAVFVVVLTVYTTSFVLTVRLGQTRKQCELRQMELQSRYLC